MTDAAVAILFRPASPLKPPKRFITLYCNSDVPIATRTCNHLPNKTLLPGAASIFLYNYSPEVSPHRARRGAQTIPT